MKKDKNMLSSGHATKSLGSPKSIGKTGRSLKASIKGKATKATKSSKGSKSKTGGRVLKEARQISPGQINGSDLDSSSARYRR